MRIAYVVGARPNFVKMAPVIARARDALPDAAHVVIHTEQHYDDAMSKAFFAELAELPDPDFALGVGPGTHAEQTARAMVALEEALIERPPDLLVVAGDVNSTLAAALVAAKLRIPLAHVESGLRSRDRTMPEEVNRVVTDSLADLLFVHSADAVENLRAEGVAEERVHFVGNTMIDSLVAIEARVRALGVAAARGLPPGGYLLVTLHRPALVDGPLLDEAVARLEQVAERMPVVFPAHPRTRQRLGAAAPDWVCDPVGYHEFLSLQADAGAVLTDSGGVQEETTYLGVPCFTLRDNTERPVTIDVGTNRLLGLRPERIAEIPDLASAAAAVPRRVPPLWDGAAAERAAAVIGEFLAARGETARAG